MAHIPDKIKDINGSKETLKLAMRITNLWFVGTPDKSEQDEMVIVDSDGDEIHVVCKMDLKENCTYVMHSFKVIKNDGQYRVCDHQYKLAFIGVTVVSQSDLDGLPFKKFKFSEFANVITGRFKPDLLVGNDQLLSCTLWEDYCLQFLEYLNELENDGPIIVLLTHARIKEAHGSYPPSVSNSLKASKLLINQLVVEIQEFKQRLSELGIKVRSVLTPRGQGSSQLSGSTQLSSKDASFSKAEAKSISKINNISEEIVCVTIGTITRIVMENHSWCYPACIQCHTKIDIDTAPFTCACGKYNERVVLRYRLEVMVNHKEESTKFLLWDRECTDLIGQSADEVNRLKIADGDIDLNASLEALNNLLGYVLAFKVKVQPKFRNVVVLKYSSDLSLINTVMDLLPDAEASSKIHIPILDSNDPPQHESQSLSRTADHDPLLGLPLTPTKQQTSPECDDEARSSQISLAQLSSNK
ncbi:hypothetical protein GLYMA_18G142200v4 [Glycine max]|uniref:DUF223 domain-containing protein n=1 Tax=Glycine max TaxID=3847 RepID=A0A0R0F9D6_SOYBN|nr:hypothetical protein GYH30_049967 [Glycine max]KRG99399.1 hypothetical protein GLYMA_18G142200v4 [Glycine max]